MDPRDLYIHTCEVFRRPTDGGGATERDAFNQPVEPAADATPSFTIPCRVSRASGGLVMAERAVDVVNVSRSLYFSDADIGEDDLVTVRDKRGRVLIERARVMHVTTVEDGEGSENHREAKITSQRQAGDVT